MKTVKMPKAMLEAWLAALRGGEYEQGLELLERDGRYCCLGVLQKCASGDVERWSDGSSQDLPTEEWLREHGVSFVTFRENARIRAPYLPALSTYADRANDLGFTFLEIADAIEACAEGV